MTARKRLWVGATLSCVLAAAMFVATPDFTNARGGGGGGGHGGGGGGGGHFSGGGFSGGGFHGSNGKGGSYSPPNFGNHNAQHHQQYDSWNARNNHFGNWSGSDQCSGPEPVGGYPEGICGPHFEGSKVVNRK
ncbi:hypothetical protein [Bauldia litoralis]|uniref:hypothetical protein n=1 Tax=Bauldia litoralis TaxID=665467 RepID=UPI003262EEAA